MKSFEHIGIKENEADKAAKQTIATLRITTTRLPYADYYLAIKRARNYEWQRSGKIVPENYTTSEREKVPTTMVGNMRLSGGDSRIGHTKLTHGHLMFDIKKCATINMHNCGMWKSDTDNETLSQGRPQIEGQQKIQYTE